MPKQIQIKRGEDNNKDFFKKKFHNDINRFIDGSRLANEKEMKYLDIFIDNKLKFEEKK